MQHKEVGRSATWPILMKSCWTVFVQELPEMGDDEDDPSLAGAYSAVLQHKQKKCIASNGKGFGKFFNFKASGEMKTDSKLPNS